MIGKIGVIAACVALAGCKSILPGSVASIPDPKTPNDAIVLVNDSLPGYRSSQTFRDNKGFGTAAVTGTTLSAKLSDNVGGTTNFSVGGGTTTNNANGSKTMRFSQGQDWGQAYLGTYSSAFAGGSNSNFNAWALVEGQKTDVAMMPRQQQATYTGNWNMFYNDRQMQSGKFTAAADFDRNTIGLNLTGDANGSGGGAIQGNGFNASFGLDTPGIVLGTGVTAQPNPYNVRGSFFGPNATEMGGLISSLPSGTAISGPNANVNDPANPFPTVSAGVLWGKR